MRSHCLRSNKQGLQKPATMAERLNNGSLLRIPTIQTQPEKNMQPIAGLIFGRYCTSFGEQKHDQTKVGKRSIPISTNRCLTGAYPTTQRKPSCCIEKAVVWMVPTSMEIFWLPTYMLYHKTGHTGRRNAKMYCHLDAWENAPAEQTALDLYMSSCISNRLHQPSASAASHTICTFPTRSPLSQRLHGFSVSRSTLLSRHRLKAPKKMLLPSHQLVVEFPSFLQLRLVAKSMGADI